jgi:hypothetical protein
LTWRLRDRTTDLIYAPPTIVTALEVQSGSSDRCNVGPVSAKMSIGKSPEIYLLAGHRNQAVETRALLRSHSCISITPLPPLLLAAKRPHSVCGVELRGSKVGCSLTPAISAPITTPNRSRHSRQNLWRCVSGEEVDVHERCATFTFLVHAMPRRKCWLDLLLISKHYGLAVLMM